MVGRGDVDIVVPVLAPGDHRDEGGILPRGQRLRYVEASIDPRRVVVRTPRSTHRSFQWSTIDWDGSPLMLL